MSEEIQKIIDELEERVAKYEKWWHNPNRAESDDWLLGKVSAYRQSIRLLRDLLERAPDSPDSPDPGGLY